MVTKHKTGYKMSLDGRKQHIMSTAVPVRKKTVLTSCGVPSRITCNESIPGTYPWYMHISKYIHTKNMKTIIPVAYDRIVWAAARVWPISVAIIFFSESRSFSEKKSLPQKGYSSTVYQIRRCFSHLPRPISITCSIHPQQLE